MRDSTPAKHYQDGHIPEFPLIRVDHFSSPPPLGRGNPWLLPRWNDNGSCTLQRAPIARLYLLTHVHTDHLVGLDNNFTGQIVCSEDTKRMLSRLEAETDRLHHIDGSRELPRRKYDGLRRREKVDYIVRAEFCWDLTRHRRRCHMDSRPLSTSVSTRVKMSRSLLRCLTRITAQGRQCALVTRHQLTFQVPDHFARGSCSPYGGRSSRHRFLCQSAPTTHCT